LGGGDQEGKENETGEVVIKGRKKIPDVGKNRDIEETTT